MPSFFSWLSACLCAAGVGRPNDDLLGKLQWLTLGTNIWEPGGAGVGTGWCNEVDAFTHTPPSGWTNDQSGIPGLADPDVGVPEWEGWSFTKKDWWAGVSGGQGRQNFTKGVGTVAVADPDEWDDFGNPDNSGADPADPHYFNAFLSTPPFSVTGGSVVLQFDSSWLPEDTQTAIIEIDEVGLGIFTEVMRWESDPVLVDGVPTNPRFHADAPNETVVLPLSIPVQPRRF